MKGEIALKRSMNESTPGLELEEGVSGWGRRRSEESAGQTTSAASSSSSSSQQEA
ncbi:GL22364 [Drosophila persimilis]|uniref:GL22364 n=1 Tax=Drosophila persimilis TaxID=7234 RepID=B4ISF8_DROPE|nr:GL22364 [Drosophila persimilis]